MRKNLIKAAIILSMLLLALTPLSANAATNGTLSGNLNWELDSNGTLTITGTGAMPDWNGGRETPWSGYGSNDSKIKKVVIGDGITTIGNSAFENFINLETITLNDDIQSVGNNSFSNCYGLKMEKLDLPYSLTSIGNSAFFGCNISIIYVPDTVTHIGTNAFAFSENLEELRVSADNNYYSSFDGNLYDANQTTLIQYLENDTEFTIPDSVTTIGEWAFYNYNDKLTSIEIPVTVTKIGYSAFYKCSQLKEVIYGGTKAQWNKINIGSSNTPLTNANITYKIENELLEYITYTISNGEVRITDCNTDVSGDHTIPLMIEDCPVITIDYNAFRDCINLESIVIPDTVTHINGSAFENCTGLSEIAFPDSLVWIGGSAFGNCTSLASIMIPATVSGLGDRAFYGCTKLENIDVNENNADFCSIKGVLFDKDLTTIIQYPIGKTESTYSIPDGVTLIKSYCFGDCINLSTITIPNSIKSVYNYAFSNCINLKNVYYNGSIEKWNKITISNYDNCNKSLINSTKTFFAYISIVDNNGIEISNKMQNMGELIDISDIKIPDSATFKLYTDNALTKEYSLDTPITENLTLYAIIKKITKIDIQEMNGIFLVTPIGVESGNRIIFACYSDDKMVYVNPYVYTGETTIPFTTTETYDKVKVMVWGNSETCVPLCEAEDVPLN